ncbi:MAG: divergent polysaccharide deacetylase family protein [Candidatus Omnitrophica bacterium]|nr:divergent polysaccharide deacetylase family protein [Candidatus Omnitrophota bacterium]
MSKTLKAIIFVVLILVPIFFYRGLSRQKATTKVETATVKNDVVTTKPKMAIIFDDLGESLSEVKEVYSLDIPVTISVIPGLKFSKNIAHIGDRCGFSVMVHMPMEPKNEKQYRTNKYKFIRAAMKRREIKSLLRYYLNSIKIAIGVNNHMGSAATEDFALMSTVMEAIKEKKLIFIDSRTSLESVAYDAAIKTGLVAGFAEGFIDAIDDTAFIEKRIDQLAERARHKGKIIVIGHPKSKTFKALKKKLPALKKEIDFVTIEDLFSL